MASNDTVRARRRPGEVRDAILIFLRRVREGTVGEIHQAVEQKLGSGVARSSVRSYLRLNPDTFERVDRGRYRLRRG